MCFDACLIIQVGKSQKVYCVHLDIALSLGEIFVTHPRDFFRVRDLRDEQNKLSE